MAAKKAPKQAQIPDKPADKRPRGRPPKTLTEEQYGMVRAMARLCISQRSIGLILGVGENTITRLLDRDNRFLGEYKRGMAEAEGIVTKQLFNLIEEGEPSAIFFALKTRFGWRETDKQQKPETQKIIVGFEVIPYDD